MALAATVCSVGGQFRGVRGAETLESYPPGGNRYWQGPDSTSNENPGDTGCSVAQACENNETRPDSSEATGSSEKPLQCVSSGPVVGDRFNVRAHLGRGRAIPSKK
jgi:hypothetical protein